MSRPNIFPALRYKDARGAIDWLVRAFGFEEQAVYPDNEGGIAHAQLRTGPGVIGLSSARAVTDHPWTKVRQGVYVHVVEVDAHHDRARAAGARIAVPLQNMDYGSREYSAYDVDGNLWGFGTYTMEAPQGPATVFPELHYSDGPAALAFLEKAFGFERGLVVPGQGGVITHAELRYGDGVVMIGSGPEGAEIWGDLHQCTHVLVEDPDAHFAHAKSAGATIVSPPKNTPWGSRGYTARDGEGFLWGFSTYRPGVISSPAPHP